MNKLENFSIGAYKENQGHEHDHKVHGGAALSPSNRPHNVRPVKPPPLTISALNHKVHKPQDTKRSPGATLRLQSATSPSPHPLPDLLHLTAEKYTHEMDRLIGSMASLSRAGKEQGHKKTNQDRCFAFKQFLKPYQALCGILDGHGPVGHLVSSYVQQELPAALAHNLKKLGELEAGTAMSHAFTATHSKLKSPATGINCRLSGTTACVVMLQGVLATAAWVGDSRAVLIREDIGGAYRGTALTQDHKPTLATELNRILAAGGRVERLSDGTGQEIGPSRVWLPNTWAPGLSMSRSLGDLVAQQIGIIPEPEVRVTEIQQHDRFLIVASDGVWEFMSIQEVADIVQTCDTAEQACTALVNAATEKWEVEEDGVVDDISVVCICFASSVSSNFDH